MSYARIDIICKECGREFRYQSNYKMKSTEVDGYIEWARENVTLCPECYRKQKAAEKAECTANKLAELGIQLPEISGVSDKQVAFAQKVRDNYIYDLSASWFPNFQSLHRYAHSSEEEKREMISASGVKTIEEFEESVILATPQIKELWVALTENNASKIIDALR